MMAILKLDRKIKHKLDKGFAIQTQIWTQLPSQSAPTILVLESWVGLWPWKKSGPYFKKQVEKNRVIFIQ